MKRIVTFSLLLMVAVCGGLLYGQGAVLYEADTTRGADNIIRRFNEMKYINVSNSCDGPGFDFTLTDLNSLVNVAFPYQKYDVKDMEILDEWVFFCGQYTGTKSGMIGWFKQEDFFHSSGALYIDNTLVASGLMTLENIEVFEDQGGEVHVVGYGISFDDLISTICVDDVVIGPSKRYRAFEAVGIPSYGMQYRTAELFGGGFYSEINDMAVTDNYVVFLNCSRNKCCSPFHGVSTNLEVLPKYNMLSVPHSELGLFMTIETSQINGPGCELVIRHNSDPHYYQAKMVHAGGDRVAVSSHRVDINMLNNNCEPCLVETPLTSYLTHRMFNLSPLQTGGSIVMLSAYAAQLPSVVGHVNGVRGVLFHDDHYSVLHEFESPAGTFNYAVTKFDFSGGVPVVAVSDYQNEHPWDNWTPESFCLTDGDEYVVSGKEFAMLHRFKRSPFVSIGGNCSVKDIWNIVPLPTIETKPDFWLLDVTAWQALVFDQIIGTRSEDHVSILCE